MSTAQQRIREMMARFEEQASAAARLKDEMGAVRGEARSQDGAVSATVAPSGAVLDLRLSPEAMRRSHSELQNSIMQTIRQATQQAAEAMNATVEPVLGDRADQFRAAYQAHGATPPAEPGAEQRPAPAPPASRRPRGDDPDDDHAPDSFLR
ncbi:YbaB/EbfC family nucleoid-associated protein [Saccharopolyspora sp. MS10]|uniref:YbaB/EbfC family nucleoid-associated protein n=1 Tax=Saccharopolyspora sp. MS10 TaxID=3385973 RepID=UPI0039A0AD7B